MNLSISGVCRAKDLVESITVAWMLARLYGRREWTKLKTMF